MKRLKKRFNRVLASYLSMMILLTALVLPTGFVSAADGSYNATLFDMSDTDTNNKSYGSYVTENSTELTPEISASQLSLGWSGASSNDNNANYIYLCTQNSNSTTQTYKFTEDSAIMFYAKMPIDSPENELFFQMVASDKGDAATNGAVQWIMMKQGAPIHYLKVGDTEWTSQNAVQSTVASNRANLILPAGFEGWIRIPYSSFVIDAAKSTEVFRLNFYLKHLGGDYTAKGVSFGTFMMVEDGTESFTSVSFDGGVTNKTILVEMPAPNSHMLYPTQVTGAQAVDNETVLKKGYTYKLDGTTADLTVSDEALVSSSVITYIRLPLDEDNKVKLTLNGIAPTAQDGVAVLNRGSDTAEAVSVDADGYIALKGGFEGYLIIPASCYSGLAGQAVTSAQLTFEKAGASFGSLMLSSNAKVDDVIRMDNYNVPVYLTKQAYYKADLLETEDTVTSNENNKNFYNVSDKTADNSFSVGVDGGYYYEMSVGSAAEDNYKIESSSVPSYTATKLTGMRPNSGYVRPVSNSPIAVTADAENGSFTISVNTSVVTSGVYETENPLSTANSYKAQVYALPRYTNLPILKASGSLMFYVSHTNATEAVKIVIGNAWATTRNNTVYYLLPKNSATWQTCTSTTAVNNNRSGYLDIPADFEGWVRIPASYLRIGSQSSYKEAQLKDFYVFPQAMGGKYGELTISNVTVVDETDDRLFFNYGEGQATPAIENIEDFDIGMSFNVSVGKVGGEKVYTTDAGAGDLYSTVTLKKAAVIKTDNALMLYVRQSGRVSSGFRIDLGDSGLRMDGGAAYAKYNANSEMWEDSTAGSNGKITVEAGFSGWIRIPFTSLTDKSGNTPAEITFSSMSLTPYELGGPYGNLKIGSFMITDNGDESLATMRVNKNDEVALTVKDVYTAKMLAAGSVLPAGDNARKLVAEKESGALLEGGYLYRVSSTYGEVSMDGTSGLEIETSNVSKVVGENALMLYVRLPENSQNALILDGVFKMASGTQYYTLAAGNESVWTVNTTAQDGSMPLSAGFDGYIRIPFTSMETAPTGEIIKFILAFSKVGGNYGEPIFGSTMITDNGTLALTQVVIDSLTYPQTLVQPDYYEGYLLQGALVEDDANDLISASTVADSQLIPEGYGFKVSANDAVIELGAKEYTPRIRFDVDEIYKSKLSSNGSVMFYVDLTGCAENTMYFQAVGDIYAFTVAGSRYSVLETGNKYWEEKVSNADGDITFKEGFKGWVRIPFASLKNTAGKYLSTSVGSINITFKNVGGDYGVPQVGNLLMLSNNGNFGSLQLLGYEDKISLYGTKDETVYARDDIAIWKSVVDSFTGYSDGDTIAMTPTIDSTVEAEVNSTFGATVITESTPFAAKGIEYSSTNAVNFHGSSYPRFSISAPFSLTGAKGIMLYVTVPDNGKDVNSLFVQVKTTSGQWYSIREELMIPVLERGTNEWKYVLKENKSSQSINLPAGFEGYVYLPLEDVVTAFNAEEGRCIPLNETDIIQNVIFGVGDFGGDLGSFSIGGIFTNLNGVLSHNGAYVDGDPECRDVFNGSEVDENVVRYSVYDAPSEVGAAIKELPTPTQTEYLVYKENIAGHSVDIVVDAYPGADRYRVDIYKTEVFPNAIDDTYYTYMGSVWSDTRTAHIEDLQTATYYTAVVSAFKGNTGLAIYSLCPVLPEAQIFGDMLMSSFDPYEYEWDDGDDEEWIYEIIYEEDNTDNTPQYEEKTYRRWVGGGMPVWQIVLIVAGSVLGAAAVAFIVILIIKKKKKKEENQC